MSKKILVVLTSVEKYPNLNRATGLWLGGAVHFVKKVQEAGYEVDYASPKGDFGGKKIACFLSLKRRT